jgi:hypothetical protein
MFQRKNRKIILIVALTAALLLAISSIAMAAVWTDQQDYLPGSVVTISGDNSDGIGYVLGNLVHVDVVGPNGYESTCDTAVGETGAWSCQVTLWDGDQAVGEYSYTAMSLAVDGVTVLTEMGTFTDAGEKIGSVDVGAQNPDTISAGDDATYIITISRSAGSGSTGAFNANLSITTVLPTGATASFSTNPVSFTPSEDSKTSTLTISTVGTTPAGTYNFTVKVIRPDGPSTDWKEDSGVLKVEASADADAPDIDCDVPDQTIWYGANVTVNCTASDSGSGLANLTDASFSLTTSVGAGIETNSAQTNSHEVCDNAENCTIAGPYTFKVDRKAPVISCTIPDQTGWYGSNVTVSCTATDNGSGLANSADANFTLSTNVASGEETASASTDSKSVADAVGNSATAGPYTFKVDRKAPSITITTPKATSYIMNQPVVADYGCSDGGSGVASCLGTVADGANIDTSTVGVHTFKVDAEDIVGNSSSATVNYSIQYNFDGFYAPVNNPDTVNSAKAGQAIPIKWQLTDFYGDPVEIMGEWSVKASFTGTCGSGELEPIETYAGSSGWQYLGGGYWQFNWKTPKSYAGLCLTMTLDLDEGITTHFAYFKFK